MSAISRNQTPRTVKWIIVTHFVIIVGVVTASVYAGGRSSALPPQAFTESLEATLLGVYSALFGLVFAASIFYMTFYEMRREHLVSRKGQADPWVGEITDVVVQRWRDIANSFIRFWIVVSVTYASVVLAAFAAYLSVAFPGQGPGVTLYYFVNYSIVLVTGDVILLVLFFLCSKPFVTRN